MFRRETAQLFCNDILLGISSPSTVGGTQNAIRGLQRPVVVRIMKYRHGEERLQRQAA
jgi:hypothetical protein